MDDSHIELGHALITMVEPYRDAVREYNRWYERDHFYSAVLTGRWAFAGRRFVATRDLKALRFPPESPIAEPVTAGSFFTFYWIEKGHLDGLMKWSYGEADRLGDEGRMNPNRDHVSTSVYDLLEVPRQANDQSVPPQIALDHPYEGLVATWVRPTGGARDTLIAIRDFFDDAIRQSPYEQVLGFVPVDFPGRPGPVMRGAGAANRLLVSFFLSAPPTPRWGLFSKLGHHLESDGIGTVDLMAPFVPTVPGTDRYIDELW